MPLRLSIPKWKFRKLELPQVDQRERPHLAFAFFCNGPCQFRVSIDPIDSIPLGNKLRLGRGPSFYVVPYYGGHRSAPRVIAALASFVHDRQSAADYEHNHDKNT
jgi:hypothetical protein